MKNVVLITRPEDSAAKTAYALHQKGYLTFCEPFINVVFHDVVLPNLAGYSALIFTSANAVRAFTLKSVRRDIMAYCVGDNTLQAVREAGFDHYKSAQGKVSDLIKMLEKESIEGKILYVRARDVAHPLVVEGKDIEEIIFYHTEKTKEISQNCLELMSQGVFSYILFHSKRTAEIFVDLVEENGVKNSLNQCEALCLGDSMVECLTNLQWKRIAVAPTPDRQGMLQLLEKLDE